MTLDDLSREFEFTKLTISRNLKKILGEKKYKGLILKNKPFNGSSLTKDKSLLMQSKKNLNEKIHKNDFNNKQIENNHEEENLYDSQFMEIAPLDCDIENSQQKDLSSVPISEVEFPNMVYMIVDKKIELEIKYLREYPEWQFLSTDELNRKTIQIYLDLKNAKRLFQPLTEIINFHMKFKA